MFNSQPFRRTVVVGIAVLVAILIPFSHLNASEIPLDASEVPFYWDSIQVEMDVQPNGDMWVTETHHYVFTAAYTNERYRYIPLNKVDEIADVTVTENEQRIAAVVVVAVEFNGSTHNSL
jgi:hypothetical protein